MKQRLTHETLERTEEESIASLNHEADESLTFDSAEAMIRHDAGRTEVPPQMRDRVLQSVAKEVRQNNPSPWWKRWMPF